MTENKLNKFKRREIEPADKTMTTSITITRRHKTILDREKLNLSSIVRNLLDELFQPKKDQD